MENKLTRWTNLHIVIDSHVRPQGPAEEKMIGNDLLDIVKTKLNSKAGYEAVFGPHLAVDTRLREVTLLNATVEKGNRFGRLHLHCIITIAHSGRFNLNRVSDGKNIYQTLCEWLIPRLPWLNDPTYPFPHPDARPYVSVRILNSRAHNYASKGVRVIGNITVEK